MCVCVGAWEVTKSTRSGALVWREDAMDLVVVVSQREIAMGSGSSSATVG